MYACCCLSNFGNLSRLAVDYGNRGPRHARFLFARDGVRVTAILAISGQSQVFNPEKPPAGADS